MLIKVSFAILFMVTISIVEGQISLSDLAAKTKCICEKKSDALWEKVIRCHDPMPESFLRTSGEASCSNNKGADYSKTPILQIFKNFCITTGTEGTWEKTKALACIAAGLYSEKKDVKAKWGEDFPDKIGTCVKNIPC